MTFDNSKKNRKERLQELVWYFDAMRRGEFTDIYTSTDSKALAEGIARLASILLEFENECSKN